MAEAPSNSKPAIQTSSSLAKALAEAVLADEVRHGGLLSRDTLHIANKLRMALNAQRTSPQ
jgi:hypothetical protein